MPIGTGASPELFPEAELLPVAALAGAVLAGVAVPVWAAAACPALAGWVAAG